MSSSSQTWIRFIKMLTCSLFFLFASNSLCKVSVFSSAASVFSCKSLIFRLTASSDVVPAIVAATVGSEKDSRCAISDRLSSDEVTSSIAHELSGGAQSECLLFVQEVPSISKYLFFWMVFQWLLNSDFELISLFFILNKKFKAS